MNSPRRLGLVCSVTCAAVLAASAARAQEVLFEDSFDRPDGPLESWTAFTGTAAIVDETLQVGSDPVEHWVWADHFVPAAAEDFSIEAVVEFINLGNNATVGRHGGFQFHCSAPTIRTGVEGFSGYVVDWIDRTEDRGIRMSRYDNGTEVSLVRGALDSPAEPPEVWRIETDETNIRVFADDLLVVDMEDVTYRGGYHGVWAWSGDQLIAYDDYVVSGNVPPVSACFEVTSEETIAGTDIFFDAACTVSGNEITEYNWDFGDGTMGSGATIEHTYAFADNYTVTLTVVDSAGNMGSASQVIAVVEVVTEYFDDFDRPDGPVDEWTVFNGEWRLEGGELAAGPTVEEQFIWAGSPPVLSGSNTVFTWDYEFISPGSNAAIGRHAGFQFHCSAPTLRAGAGEFQGYFVDWIDREADRGLRLSRRDPGAFVTLVEGQGADATEPPGEWRVEVVGPSIKVWGDDVLLIDVIDETYRGGFFGFWTWIGDQEIRADNLRLESPDSTVVPCFEITSGAPLAGTEITFDAACTQEIGGAQASTYSWDFGDGGVASGLTAAHTYAFADNYTVTLSVEDAAGDVTTFSDIVSVSDSLLPFADCFDESDPGPVSGWTPVLGEWDVTDTGELATLTAGSEHWVWAGSPPLYGVGNLVAEFELVFNFDPMDGVGRHGGVAFHADQPTVRFGVDAFSGYFVDWIDRPNDRGFRLLRSDAGAHQVLVNGTPDAPFDPPEVWRIETDDTHIRVYGDDDLLVEFEDATYREGHFGLWMYSNNQDVRFDNVLVGSDSLPACGDDPQPGFVRGDSDASGTINLADGIQVLNFLFQGDAEPACLNAADADDQGGLQLTDGVRIFNYLFTGGPAPAEPSPQRPNFDGSDCGQDVNAPDLGCENSPPVCS